MKNIKKIFLDFKKANDRYNRILAECEVLNKENENIRKFIAKRA